MAYPQHGTSKGAYISDAPSKRDLYGAPFCFGGENDMWCSPSAPVKDLHPLNTFIFRAKDMGSGDPLGMGFFRVPPLSAPAAFCRVEQGFCCLRSLDRTSCFSKVSLVAKSS